MNKLTIRVKIMLWYTLLTGILLAAFIPMLYQTISQSLYKGERELLYSAMSQITAYLDVENGVASFDGTLNLSPGIYVVITNDKGETLFSNNSLSWIADEPFVVGEVRILEATNSKWMFYDELFEDDENIAFIHSCSSYAHIERSLNNLRLIVLFGALAFLAIAILGGLFLAGRALSPISAITKKAQEIGIGDLADRISGIHSKDEVGLLADTFNRMLERLEVSFNKEKQFASDASHELRTPVAIIMAHAEDVFNEIPRRMRRGINGIPPCGVKGVYGTAPRGGVLNPFVSNKLPPVDEHTSFSPGESMEIILKESNRMNVIISQLLMLTRGCEGKYPLELERFDLRVVMEEVTHQMKKAAA